MTQKTIQVQLQAEGGGGGGRKKKEKKKKGKKRVLGKALKLTTECYYYYCYYYYYYYTHMKSKKKKRKHIAIHSTVSALHYFCYLPACLPTCQSVAARGYRPLFRFDLIAWSMIGKRGLSSFCFGRGGGNSAA